MKKEVLRCIGKEGDQNADSRDGQPRDGERLAEHFNSCREEPVLLWLIYEYQNPVDLFMFCYGHCLFEDWSTIRSDFWRMKWKFGWIWQVSRVQVRGN